MRSRAIPAALPPILRLSSRFTGAAAAARVTLSSNTLSSSTNSLRNMKKNPKRRNLSPSSPLPDLRPDLT